MNPALDKVLHYLTGFEDIDAISVNDLQKLADESPYFSVVQFMLAKKMMASGETDCLPQVQKAALYFSNPFWLHYQLTHDPSFNVPDEVARTEESPSTNIDEASLEQIPVTDNAAEANKDELQTNPVFLKETLQESSKENNGETTSEQYITTSVTPANNPLATEANANKETEEVLEAMAGVTYSNDDIIIDFLKSAALPEETIEIVEPAQLNGHNTITPEASENNNQEPDNDEPDEHERMFQNIKAMLDATSEEANANVENATIPIDPYYTIDYFASQGIKLDLDQNPKDQLGQNLKKFTQWLKHMKKLGPEDATEVINRTETDADIQKIADSSNTVREVVTEAMASVLEKQGKNQKAIELYSKLSFLNPHKSTYFAAKIQHLKGV